MIGGALTFECDECSTSVEVMIDGGVFVPIEVSSGSVYAPLDAHWPAGWMVDDGLDLCPKCASHRKERAIDET